MDNMKIKDKIRKMLYRMGKINVLPASVINSVKIVENHDPMVDIKQLLTTFISTGKNVSVILFIFIYII